MLFAFALSSSLALAADPVLAGGEDPRITLTRASAAAERPDTELRVLTFPELAGMHPAVVEGGGQVLADTASYPSARARCGAILEVVGGTYSKRTGACNQSEAR